MNENRRRPVLIADGSDGQSRSSLAAVRALGAAGYAVAVTDSGRSSLAASSRYCQRRIRVPNAGADGFRDAVRAELASRAYLCVLPASDMALIALESPAAELVDKARLAARARAAGIPVLPTAEYSNGEDLLSARDVTFPIVVKPTAKTGGGFAEAVRIDDRAGLGALARTLTCEVVVQPFVDAPLDAIGGVVWNGRLVAALHQRTLRTWPVACGVSSAAESLEPDLAKEERLPELLRGHDGVFQVQYLGSYLIDCNPRVYGSLPLATAAGLNLPAIACRSAQGDVPALLARGRVGARYRWIEGDVRNLAARVAARSLRRTEVFTALRPRRGTAHSIESLADPMPALARLRYVALERRR